MEWRLQVTLEWNRLRFETWNSIQREDLKSNSKLREKISVGNKKGGRGKKDPRTTQQNVATKPNTLNPSLLIVWGWVYSGSGQSKASMQQLYTYHVTCASRCCLLVRRPLQPTRSCILQSPLSNEYCLWRTGHD